MFDDGYGIRCALTSDIEVAIITGRKAKLVEDRCATLGITHLYQGQSNKLIAFSDLLENWRLPRKMWLMSAMISSTGR